MIYTDLGKRHSQYGKKVDDPDMEIQFQYLWVPLWCVLDAIRFYSVTATILSARRRIPNPIRRGGIHNWHSCLVAFDRSNFFDWLCWRKTSALRSCFVSKRMSSPSMSNEIDSYLSDETGYQDLSINSLAPASLFQMDPVVDGTTSALIFRWHENMSQSNLFIVTLQIINPQISKIVLSC